MCETAVWTGFLESRIFEKSRENSWMPLEPQGECRSPFSMQNLLRMSLLSYQNSKTFHHFSWSSCTRESELSKLREFLRISDFQFPGFLVSRFFWFLTKGPSRTKNTTATQNIVNYYAVAFLLRPLYLLRREPFFDRKKACKNPGNWNLHRGRRDSESLRIVNSLRVVNLLRVVFLVRPGPLGRDREI